MPQYRDEEFETKPIEEQVEIINDLLTAVFLECSKTKKYDAVDGILEEVSPRFFKNGYKFSGRQFVKRQKKN